MKKILSSVCIATVAMAFAGCSSEDATQDPAPEARKVTLSITADQAGTRTVIGDDNKISWTENDAIEVLEKSDKGIAYAASTGCTLAEGKAGFTVTLPANASSDLIYAAVYPASAFLSENYSDLTKIKAILPATQTPTAASFDPAADLMISQAVHETTQPTEEGLAFSFGRVAALAKMTITGLDLADGETVRQVSFAAAERKLAGRCYLDLANGKVGALGYSNASERIVLDYSAVTGIGKASFPVWFACLPCDLGAGDAFTVVVTSDKNKTYTKNVTLAEAQTLSFTSGRLSTFAVDMTGIAGEETASGARVATLTYEEVGKLGMAYDTPVEYTNAGGTWTIVASKQNSMQINGSKGYIGLPEFTNDISLVRVTTHALSKEATLMLNTSNSTSGAAVSQSQDAESTSFTLVAADAGLKTGYIKSNAVVQITQIEVYTGAAIYLDDLAVSARETTDATTTYRAIAFTANDDTTVSAFDGCVSAASVDPDTKTLTYSVSANTTGAERKGTITLVAAANGAETTVDVSQAADVFKADPETVTLGGDANAATELTLTSDFEVGTPAVSAPDKFKIEGGAEGKYTVTALADGGAEETELGTITFTRTIDDKQIVVPVKQAAKGDVGYTEFWKDDFSNCTTSNTKLSKLSGSLAAFTGDYSGLTKIYPMDGAIKIGTSDGNGAITTPRLTGIGDQPVSLKITFKAEGWNSKTAKLTLKVNNGGTVSGENGQTISSSTTMAGNTPCLSEHAPTYTFIVDNATSATTLTFNSSGGAVGMDDLLIATD